MNQRATITTAFKGNALTTRLGSVEDAAVLERTFAYAGHGLAQHLWAKHDGPGVDLKEVIRERMIKRITDPENHFAVAEVAGEPAGSILSYDIGSEAEDTSELSPMVRAMVEAENDLLNSHYINALAVFPEYRRMGVAKALINAAAQAASVPLSLTVCDTNRGAVVLYESLGFREVSCHEMVKEDWDGDGNYWISMRRDN